MHNVDLDQHEWYRKLKNQTCPIFLEDFYKSGHAGMYKKGISKIWSNYTPRYGRGDTTGMLWFGIQYFMKEYLFYQFNELFFKRPWSEIEAMAKDFYRETLQQSDPPTDHLRELHRYGRMPLDIYSIPEGSFLPYGVPGCVITNTDPRFFWLPNKLETLLSCTVWGPSTSATTAAKYREIFTRWSKKFGETDLGFVDFMGHDFSMRGMWGVEGATISGMGHLLSFSGTDTEPAIWAAKKYYGAEGFVAGSVPACYDDQTEVLTASGFKLFRDLVKHDVVAQYHPDKSITFVAPLETFADPYSGNMIKFSKPGYGYIDMSVTPNHRMVRRNFKSGKLDMFEAGDRSYDNRNGYSHRSKIVVAGHGRGPAITLTPLERLRIAFQADGSYPSRKKKYTGSRTGMLPIRFSFKKDRKFARLCEILEAIGCEYTHEKYEDGYYSFWIKIPEPMVKDFSWVNLPKISCSWAREFVEELSHWDGHHSSKNTISYTSTLKTCVDMAQAVGVLGGYKTHTSEYLDGRGDRLPSHTVIFTTNKDSVGGTGCTREEVPYLGKVYCVSVPTKMLVTRRNGTVAICGNTEHSVMQAGGMDGEFETFERLLFQTYPGGILSIVSDTWNLWTVLTDFIPRLKSRLLERPGTLVIRPDTGDPVKILTGDPDSTYGPERAGVLRLLAQAMGTDGAGHLIKVGAIYGDGISPERAEQIHKRTVEEVGLSPFSVVLGLGSYSYTYVTRDNHGQAMKATAVICDGSLTEIFKEPVTDVAGSSKKSHRGIPLVYHGENGLFCHDHGRPEDLDNCAYVKIMSDGHLAFEDTFAEIRKRVRA